jgi:hypothetical protein
MYDRGLTSEACVAPVCKAAGEMGITICFQILSELELNELVVASN